MTRRSSLLPSVCALALVACVLACQGCYQRVVAARGLGAGAYDVSEPYQENSKVDDWLFGEKQGPNDRIVRQKPMPTQE